MLIAYWLSSNHSSINYNVLCSIISFITMKTEENYSLYISKSKSKVRAEQTVFDFHCGQVRMVAWVHIFYKVSEQSMY